MAEQFTMEQEDIFSRVMRAGRRTYFFDVRSTKAGDYYLTITESKKFTNEDGSFHYKKHKIYLYKEDFEDFINNLQESTEFIISEKGEEVISERHQRNYRRNFDNHSENSLPETDKTDPSNFTDIEFDDI